MSADTPRCYVTVVGSIRPPHFVVDVSALTPNGPPGSIGANVYRSYAGPGALVMP